MVKIFSKETSKIVKFILLNQQIHRLPCCIRYKDFFNLLSRFWNQVNSLNSDAPFYHISISFSLLLSTSQWGNIVTWNFFGWCSRNILWIIEEPASIFEPFANLHKSLGYSKPENKKPEQTKPCWWTFLRQR